MTATEDVQVALRTLTELTSVHPRGYIVQMRDDAELRSALRRAAPAIIDILAGAYERLEAWPSDDLGTQRTAVKLARLVNGQEVT